MPPFLNAKITPKSTLINDRFGSGLGDCVRYQDGRLTPNAASLNFIFNALSNNLAGASQAAFVCLTVTGGIYAGCYIIGVDTNNIAESCIAL